MDKQRLKQVEGISRTGIKAILQLVPGGGALAEIIGHVWTDPAQRRIESFLKQFEVELERLRVDLAVVQDRLKSSEPAQVLFLDALNAAVRLTSEKGRKQLACFLASGLSATDRETADIAFLLRGWTELDDVEKAIFWSISAPMTHARTESWIPEELGIGYFGGETHDLRMKKDVIHRSRMEHLVRLGLLRARDEKGWQEHKIGYQFSNFIATNIGLDLRMLLGGG